MRHIIKGIMAGMCITIGCNVYITCENKIVGSFLFAIGLITILLFDFYLYTGKVGYIVEHDINYFGLVCKTLLGNAIGCLITGLAFSTYTAADHIFTSKLDIELLPLIVKSIGCGLFMYIAVESYKQIKNFLPVIMCVMGFILCKFEHSIADMGYMAIERAFTLEGVGFLVIVILGNAIGGMLIPLYKIINNKLEKR